MSEYRKMRCQICGHIYNPDKGEGAIEPGTPFEDLPDVWVCPICSADKSKFAEVA
ncbi:MAG: rubredoxin [Methanomicrobiaceae archaeon]|nr:rubredoxin [Methanomicrobiaceae archaeon]